MRVSHGARPAAACSVSLRCHQSRDTDRTLLDDMETVFVLIAFRRFAQFSGNQRKRTDSGDEKACGYDHDANRQARFAPLPVGSTLSYRQAISRLSIRQSYQWGNARRKLTCAIGEFFPQTGLAPSFYQRNPSDFGQSCQVPDSREAIFATRRAALGGEHFLRWNFHLQRSPEKIQQHSDPFSCRQELGDDDFEPLKRPLYNVNWLANFWGRIDRDDFFGASL